MASATMKQSPLLTPSQAADFLNVKPQTLAVWRSTARYNIPFVKVGQHVRYRLADLEKWIEERTVTPETIGN